MNLCSQSKTLQYYEWWDIEKFLCLQLGIEQDKFRDYHKVVGGDYNDFWHVWLDLAHDIYNGVISCFFLDEDCWLWKLEAMAENGQDWVMDLVEPLRKLKEEVGKDAIWIYYNW